MTNRSRLLDGTRAAGGSPAATGEIRSSVATAEQADLGAVSKPRRPAARSATKSERPRVRRLSAPPPDSRPGPPGGVRDTNRRARTQALVDAALGLFLARGVEAVSIEDITRAADMAKAGFYRYFADKEALVCALYAPISEEILGALKDCGETLERATKREELIAAYDTLGRRFLAAFLQDAGAARLYLQECRGPALGARAPIRALSDAIAHHAIAVTRQAHTQGMLKPITPAVSALAVVGAVERLLFAVLSGEEVGNPLEVPDALTTLILDGLRLPSKDE